MPSVPTIFFRNWLWSSLRFSKTNPIAAALLILGYGLLIFYSYYVSYALSARRAEVIFDVFLLYILLLNFSVRCFAVLNSDSELLKSTLFNRRIKSTYLLKFFTVSVVNFPFLAVFLFISPSLNKILFSIVAYASLLILPYTQSKISHSEKYTVQGIRLRRLKSTRLHPISALLLQNKIISISRINLLKSLTVLIFASPLLILFPVASNLAKESGIYGFSYIILILISIFHLYIVSLKTEDSDFLKSLNPGYIKYLAVAESIFFTTVFSIIITIGIVLSHLSGAQLSLASYILTLICSTAIASIYFYSATCIREVLNGRPVSKLIMCIACLAPITPLMIFFKTRKT